MIGYALVAAAVLLIVNAVFSFATWPAFLRRVSRDPRARDASGRTTRFLTVHRVIVAVALVLAALSLLVGAALGILLLA